VGRCSGLVRDGQQTSLLVARWSHGGPDNATIRDAGLFLDAGDHGRQALGLDLDDRAIHEAMILLADASYVQFREQPEGGAARSSKTLA
jgi:hypothetical protein